MSCPLQCGNMSKDIVFGRHTPESLGRPLRGQNLMPLTAYDRRPVTSVRMPGAYLPSAFEVWGQGIV